MRTYKTISIQKQEIEKIQCNVCGTQIGKDPHGNFEDHLHIEKAWGYHSDRDGEVHHLDICQKCYEKLFKKIKIPPKKQIS